MNRGLLQKSLREIWPVTVGFGILLLATKAVISFVLPALHDDIVPLLLKMGFVRTLLSALLGTPITEDMGAQLLFAVPWVHPLVLLIMFAHEITVCTQLPVGEIDRGTVDILLGLPVSRGQVYACHSFVWAVSGVALMAVSLIGDVIGAALAGSPVPPAGRLAATMTNGYCLYIAVGCLTYFLSCVSNRRGRAIGAVMTIVIGSFLINFLAEFWKPAKAISFLSLLSYYRPIAVPPSGTFPLGDIGVLAAMACVFWTAGVAVFKRRDICTL